MKRKITTLCLTLVTAIFAQDVPVTELPHLADLQITPIVPVVEPKPTNSSFGYLRMEISDAYLPTEKVAEDLLPGLGLGYRLSEGAYAIDISVAYNRRKISGVIGPVRTYVYTLPKVDYFRYISPLRNNSFYAGGGLAWGGVKLRDDRVFHGIIPNVAVGYEMKRHETLRTFAELTVSQPLVAASQKGSLPGPYAELSVGAGF